MGIILASASPRRQELFKKITEDFVCIPSNADESYSDDIQITDVPKILAIKKALEVSQNHPEDIIIGCDTGVFCDGIMLGKPIDDNDAFSMLQRLSGRSHSVITGCAIIEDNNIESFSCETKVSFYKLSDNEIKRYIASGEGTDKAGSYGIQEKGALFIREICGDYFNVVGLPVAELYRALKNFIDL